MPTSPRRHTYQPRRLTPLIANNGGAKRLPPSQRGYDERWERVRRVVLERDGWLCQDCGKPGNQVDHIIHKTVRPDLHYEPTNLQVLCISCHAKKSAKEQAAFKRGEIPELP